MNTLLVHNSIPHFFFFGILLFSLLWHKECLITGFALDTAVYMHPQPGLSICPPYFPAHSRAVQSQQAFVPVYNQKYWTQG